MKHDPISGPIPRHEFRKLATAPHGEALRVIRKHDPLFGREPGEKIKWRVEFERRARERGYGVVEAATLKEAQELAEKLKAREIDWEPDWNSDEQGEVVSLEPDVEPDAA